MFTSGIGTFCLKPIKFSLNIIQKYNLQNKFSTTTLRPIIAIVIVGKRGSRLIAILRNRRRLIKIVHWCQPYNFLFDSNSRLCSICYCLQDNHVWSSRMYSTRFLPSNYFCVVHQSANHYTDYTYTYKQTHIYTCACAHPLLLPHKKNKYNINRQV